MPGASEKTSAGAPAPLTLAGLELGRLLDVLGRAGAVGTVHVTAGDQDKRLYLIDGHLAGVASSDERERLGQLLLVRGLVTEQQLAEALAVQQRLRAPLGQILLRAGAIEESMLLAPMVFEEQVLGVIVLSKLGLDQFTDGHLRLTPGAPVVEKAGLAAPPAGPPGAKK
jgi:transcriptional regulator with GAF, ATPase, and Fis domain